MINKSQASITTAEISLPDGVIISIKELRTLPTSAFNANVDHISVKITTQFMYMA